MDQKQQILSIVKNVHGFLTAFDRVPGGHAKQWGEMLEALAVVGNFLVKEWEDAPKVNGIAETQAN